MARMARMARMAKVRCPTRSMGHHRRIQTQVPKGKTGPMAGLAISMAQPAPLQHPGPNIREHSSESRFGSSARIYLIC